MKQQEIKALTGLRGVAATMVMLYHFNTSVLFAGAFAAILGHGYLMVDLFLILSGFIIAMVYGQKFEVGISGKDYGSFLLRRIARIYPMYALMIISSGILVATGWMDHWPGPPVPVSGVIDLTMMQSLVHVPSLDTPGWSVSAEWIVNLLFPLLALLCLRRSWRWVLITAIVAFVTLPLLTIVPALAHEPKRAGLLDIWNYGTIYPVIRCIADFLLGMVAYRVSHLRWLQTLVQRRWLAPLLLAVIIFLMAIKRADVLIVTLFPFFILTLIAKNNIVSAFLGSKPIYRLGIISYSIYLIHNQMNYFMLALARKLQAVGLGYTTANLLAIGLFVVLVIVLADFAYRFIEKPARNAINKWTRRKNAALSKSNLTTQRGAL